MTSEFNQSLHRIESSDLEIELNVDRETQKEKPERLEYCVRQAFREVQSEFFRNRHLILISQTPKIYRPKKFRAAPYRHTSAPLI